MSWPWIVLIISASFVLLRVMLYHIQVMIEEGSEYHRFIKMRYKEFEPLYYMAPESYELYHFQENGPCIRYIDDDLQAYHIFFPTCHEWLKAKKNCSITNIMKNSGGYGSNKRKNFSKVHKRISTNLRKS